MRISRIETTVKDGDTGESFKIIMKDNGIVSEEVDGIIVPITQIEFIFDDSGSFIISLDDRNMDALIDVLMTRQHNKIV